MNNLRRESASERIARDTETVIAKGETFVELHIKSQHKYNLENIKRAWNHTKAFLISRLHTARPHHKLSTWLLIPTSFRP